MTLQYGLLGLLSYRESTGYDLSKIFADSLNNFWHAQPAQIYRELDRMESKGWVISQAVIQDKRPNKRLYRLSEAGRQVYQQWLLAAKMEFENPHEALLMRIFFGGDAIEVTRDLLETCRDTFREIAVNYPKKIEADIARYAAELPGGDRNSLYWQMTLDFAVMQSQAIAAWAESCLAKLAEEN